MVESISPDDVQRFLDEGAITVDTPLSPDAIRAGAAAIDARLPFIAPTATAPANYRYGETCSFFDPALVTLIEHPFFEDTARRILDADHVGIFQTAITIVYPEPGAQWGFEQHVDVHYRDGDWRAQPRRVICSLFLWLSDVSSERAPMVCRPGSHRLLAREGRRGHPHVAGVGLDALPRHDYGEPALVLARAGQVSVVTTGMVHGTSVNVDDEPRRALVMTYTARGVRIDLPAGQEIDRRHYLRTLAEHLSPARRHIAAR
ncbi:MAG: phytanoyl-CoA dioxygenase family protein [Acidimicrobiales bacterium]